MIKLSGFCQWINKCNSASVTVVILFFSLQLFAQNIVDKSKTMNIFSANQLLSKTINIGFTLDAPFEGAWGHTLVANEFVLIKEAGFTAIRLPIQWVTRMDSTAPYTIDTFFLARVDWAIEQALKNKLAIILDNHLDEQLMANPDEFKERFLKLWSQLAVHYKSFPQSVMFEIMAEPHGELEKIWEEYFTDALKIIRNTNPTRPVLIGPILYNLPYKINSLTLPQNDEYIIATFHLYDPVKFTMQGEAWFPVGKPLEWIGTKWTGTDSEKAGVVNFMDIVSSWAKVQNKPVFFGEFGVSDNADIESRIRFITFYRTQAELHKFSWGYWNFAVNFSLFDLKTNKWKIELLNALISPSKTSLFR